MGGPSKTFLWVHFGPCVSVGDNWPGYLWGWTAFRSVSSLKLEAPLGPFILGWECLGSMAERIWGSRKAGALGIQAGMQYHPRRNLDKLGKGWSDCSGSIGTETGVSAWGANQDTLISGPAWGFSLLGSGTQDGSSPWRLPREQSLPWMRSGAKTVLLFQERHLLIIKICCAVCVHHLCEDTEWMWNWLWIFCL